MCITCCVKMHTSAPWLCICTYWTVASLAVSKWVAQWSSCCQPLLHWMDWCKCFQHYWLDKNIWGNSGTIWWDPFQNLPLAESGTTNVEASLEWEGTVIGGLTNLLVHVCSIGVCDILWAGIGLFLASSPVHVKNGEAPGSHCLRMHLISPRCGDSGLFSDSSTLCDIRVRTRFCILVRIL